MTLEERKLLFIRNLRFVHRAIIATVYIMRVREQYFLICFAIIIMYCGVDNNWICALP